MRLILIMLCLILFLSFQNAVTAQQKQLNDSCIQNFKKLISESHSVSQAGTLEKATGKNYFHSLDISALPYVVRLKKQRIGLTKNTLPAFIKSHQKEINEECFNIITSDKTSYKEVVDALDQMAINNIKRYKLLIKDRTY